MKINRLISPERVAADGSEFPFFTLLTFYRLTSEASPCQLEKNEGPAAAGRRFAEGAGGKSRPMNRFPEALSKIVEFLKIKRF